VIVLRAFLIAVAGTWWGLGVLTNATSGAFLTEATRAFTAEFVR
jgi:hypothetical protein